MKYCPKCGNLLNGETHCLCGLEYDKEELNNYDNLGVIINIPKTGMMDIKKQKNKKNSKKDVLKITK